MFSRLSRNRSFSRLAGGVLASASGSGGTVNTSLSLYDARIRFARLFLIVWVAIKLLLAVALVQTLGLEFRYLPVTLFDFAWGVTALYLLRRENGLRELTMNAVALLLAIVTFSISVEPAMQLNFFVLFMASVAAIFVLARPQVLLIAVIIMLARLGVQLDSILPDGIRSLVDGTITSEEVYIGFSFLIQFFIPFFVGSLFRSFTNYIRTSTIQIQRSNEIIQRTAETMQAMSGQIRIESVAQDTVNILRDEFGFEEVRIYLMNNDNSASPILLNASLPDDEKLFVSVGSANSVGYALRTGEISIERATPARPLRETNTRRADIRSDIAIPIREGNIVIGALNVQSTRYDVFGSIEIRVIQLLASQLTVSIRNARLFEAMSGSIDENRLLYEEAQRSLSEIRRLNRQLTRQSWSDYLQARQQIEGLSYSSRGYEPQNNWTTLMVESAQANGPRVQQRNEKLVVAVPLRLRDQIIGAIEIEIDAVLYGEDTVLIAQSISDRLAIGLENARLFEETQSAFAEGQRINEISSEYESANTVDELLQITLQRLAETLGAESGAIRLGQHDTGGFRREVADVDDASDTYSTIEPSLSLYDGTADQADNGSASRDRLRRVTEDTRPTDRVPSEDELVDEWPIPS